ncbi:MAG: hypothetical protein AUK31_05640 [Fibrobacteres bacterium CG2_30_45_31]|nr:MAG: hypothetical protein AUK31_05640 [Fibrobacteres bacterium CG2_30_45_31]
MFSLPKILGIIVLITVTVFATNGPHHKSVRAYSMGNAHVAVVDDKEAIYYNYAGLNQLGKLGDFKNFPQQGYYPNNYMDMRLNVGSAAPLNEFRDAYELASDLQGLYQDARDDAKAANQANPLVDATTEKAYIDSLAKHPELIDRINSYDHQLFSMIAKLDAELAIHNFGGAIWVDGELAPYVDGGIIIPFVGIDTFYIDAVIQAGGAYGITDDFAIGLGVKAVKRQSIEIFKVDVSNFSSIVDTLNDRAEVAQEEIFEFDEVAYGMDFGVLYQVTREARLGAALNNVFFSKLDEKKITPDLTVGMNYSPHYFNRNTAYSRKLNIAADFADALNDDQNYKFFSHINFGMELEQVLLAFPGYNDNLRLLKLRLAGGFKGGYPTAGVGVEALRLIQVDLVTWGEERGYYTGQDENRIYMAQVSLGF